MSINEQIIAAPNDMQVKLFTLQNGKTQVKITNIGATITSIQTPDKDGNMGEIVLGFDDPLTYLDKAYLTDGFFLGATVGRYANRIAEGKFSIDGKNYQLEINNGPNHLHGGTGSFNTKLWQADAFEANDNVGVQMQYTSVHMENGYPGTLNVKVVFTLQSNGALKISYQATTDKTTILNLTNHSYFNLYQAGSNIMPTEVTMQADKYTPKDEFNIPTGEFSSVIGTPLDFTFAHTIGERVAQFEDGYDHNYIINGVAGTLRLAAEAFDPRSGRKLRFSTTEPGFQFYTAHYVNDKWGRKGFGQAPTFPAYGGFCFEAQHYPDSPNKPQFPTVVLKPGETYTQTTVYEFA